MAERNITTAWVRGAYIDGTWAYGDTVLAGRDFDRWLAEHDARVIAEFVETLDVETRNVGKYGLDGLTQTRRVTPWASIEAEGGGR